MTLVSYGEQPIPIELIKQLLYAVGAATDEKLSSIVEQVYSQGNARLYVLIDNDGSPLGIIGFKVEGASAKILHIAVDEHRRNCGIGRRMINELLKLENPTELTTETDHDAVDFYRRCGFEIQSLGESYPGTERFHCCMSFS